MFNRPPMPPPPFPMPPMMPFPPQMPQPQIIPSAAAPVEVGKPSCTLYLQNLPERPNPCKHLPPVLEEMFSAFGPLRRKPVVRKRLALKGQAWIIFEKQEDAQRAIAALQGTRIWGKSVVIRFARFRSDAVVREEGGEAAVEAEKRAREQDKIERAKNPRITKRQQLAQLMNSANPSAALQNVSIAGPDVLLPNKILFVQNVPMGYALAALKDQFKRFPGLVEVRGVPNRPDLAFVEFETEAGAGAARQIVDRQELVPGQAPVRVSFARSAQAESKVGNLYYHETPERLVKQFSIYRERQALVQAAAEEVGCADFLAGDDLRKKGVDCDISAVLPLFAGTGFLTKRAFGESLDYSIALIDKFREDFPQANPIPVYDIACKLDRSLGALKDKSPSLDGESPSRLVIPAFHVHCHNEPQYMLGIGMVDGEQAERVWANMSWDTHLSLMRPENRRDFISIHLNAISGTMLESLPANIQIMSERALMILKVLPSNLRGYDDTLRTLDSFRYAPPAPTLKNLIAIAAENYHQQPRLP